MGEITQEPALARFLCGELEGINASAQPSFISLIVDREPDFLET